MTLAFELDINSVNTNQRVKISRSEVIYFKSYCPNTQTHIQRTVCSTWTTNYRAMQYSA